jgi:DNA uptake protein ComE-like DNA-binding protein
MPLITSNQHVDPEQKKDDRLVILLGIGIFLLIIFCFRHLHIFPASSHKYLSLQWNDTGIVVAEADSFAPSEEKDNSVGNDLIPAALTPFFFASLPINEADQKLLETLPGIGPHLASEIIKTRSLQGHFRSPEDLLLIRGIGRKRMLKFAELFSYR